MAEASLRREALTCLICEELLRDPATLPCGHSFCLDCIQHQWDLQTSCSCPKCSETFSPRPPLSKNTVLAKLMAGLRAPSADHREHRHESYNFLSPANVQAPRQQKETELQRLKQEAQDMCSSAHSALQCCGDIFREMALLLEKQRAEVEQQIRSELDHQLRRIQQLQEHLELRGSFSALSLTPDCNQSTLHTSLLSTDAPGTEARMDFESISLDVLALGQKLQITLGDFNLSRSEQVKSTASRSPRKEQDRTRASRSPRREQDRTRASRSPRREQDWTRASGSSGKEKDWNEASWSPSPGKVLQHVSEPCSREEFLKYTKIITVNGNTANEWLHVHPGSRKVSSLPQGHLKPQHPDKFKYLRQILGSDGLTGRCYFELEWYMWQYGGMDVAMSYPDIRRDDFGDDCLFGYNDKSWALRCEIDSYSFLSNKVLSQIPDPVGNRIGIYLDHDAGILCFYRVQGQNMRLLHRVQTRFTQPLYAGARLWGHSSHVLFLNPSVKESLGPSCVVS